ncbi:unnamed protein product [Parnassius apollo]|uniref:(apollo) hypothetical protein n=1 Tax=Parnassius apollo TaxID=110799 RepID=A0A8S3Y302_PARAO|nr:unnamed protein product [Parnassius apollo]
MVRSYEPILTIQDINMVLKQRASGIIGKALHNSNISFRVQRKLNFHSPVPPADKVLLVNVNKEAEPPPPVITEMTNAEPFDYVFDKKNNSFQQPQSYLFRAVCLKKKGNAKQHKKYFDYLSDDEDFTAIFEDAIASDTYKPSSDSSDYDEKINNAN